MWSKAVIRRRTNNTIAKRKKTKVQTLICKALHKKFKNNNTNPTKNRSELRWPGRVGSSTSDTRRVKLFTNSMTS